MTANLPLVDPLKVHAPVLLVRGEYDGIATEVDPAGISVSELPAADRQFIILPGAAHAPALGINRQQIFGTGCTHFSICRRALMASRRGRQAQKKQHKTLSF